MCDQGSLRSSSSSFWSLLLCVQAIWCRQLLSSTQSISSISVADDDVLLFSWTVSLILFQPQAFSPPSPLPLLVLLVACFWTSLSWLRLYFLRKINVVINDLNVTTVVSLPILKLKSLVHPWNHFPVFVFNKPYRLFTFRTRWVKLVLRNLSSVR